MIPMPAAADLVALALTSALTAASGAVHIRSRAPLAFALVALSALVTFVVPAVSPAFGFFCRGLSALAFFRNLDLYRDPARRRLDVRVAHMLAGFDVRRVQIVPRGLDHQAWLRVLAFGPITLVAASLVHALADARDVPMRLAYALAGVVWAYASFEALTSLVRAVYRLFGVEVPKLHDDPIKARTLAEFWGERWNLMVQRMLHDHAFRPIARRWGLAAAVLAGFSVSALLHFWLLVGAAPIAMSLSMAGFFVVHGVLVLIERALGVRHFRPCVGRVWTVTTLAVTMPLFLPPLLGVAFHAR